MSTHSDDSKNSQAPEKPLAELENVLHADALLGTLQLLKDARNELVEVSLEIEDDYETAFPELLEPKDKS